MQTLAVWAQQGGESLENETLFTSQKFHVERLNHVTSDGTSLAKDVVRHPGSVAILPLLADGRICLIRNHRVTVGQTLIELPAGTMEPPEPPLECAHRELIEETGYRAGEMQLLGSFFPAPGILDEEMHLFIATGLQAGDPAREPGEEIENYLVSFAEACLLYTSPSPRDATLSRMPSSA